MEMEQTRVTREIFETNEEGGRNMERPTLIWLEDGEKMQIIYDNGYQFQRSRSF
jgi:hypothetical protein